MIDIIFEDNHLLVLNKPANLLTEPSGTVQENLLDLAKEYLVEKYQKKGQAYLGIVHRLDKPASGIVVFAKTSKALSRLNQSMRDKKFKKMYTAIVDKKLPFSEGSLVDYLVHDEFKAFVTTKNDPKSKLCKLTYCVSKKIGTLSYLEIILETGRYHQIRAQLANIGCPIVGDQKYGSLQILPLRETIALHHTRLEVLHPVTANLMIFEADLPEYFLFDEKK